MFLDSRAGIILYNILAPIVPLLVICFLIILIEAIGAHDSRHVKQCSLRKRIDESKVYYQEHYGDLTWQWYDEGLPNAILDYHSSVGSLLDFSKDDFEVAEENGYSREEIAMLCDEKEF